jgi:hypothetical protein
MHIAEGNEAILTVVAAGIQIGGNLAVNDLGDKKQREPMRGDIGLVLVRVPIPLLMGTRCA